jgi:hypothetical protein
MPNYNLPSPWNPGYALPDYVQSEPPGRGTFTTGYIERGTIDTLLPNIFGSPGEGGALKGKRGLGSLGGCSLGDMVGPVSGLGSPAQPGTSILRSTGGKAPTALLKPGFRGDPIAAYGKTAAAKLVSSIQVLDPAVRSLALKAVLDQINPSLYPTIASKATALQKKTGIGAKVALERAMAASLANGFAAELVEAGKTGTVKMVSQVGLGMYGPVAVNMALGGLLSSITSGVKSVAGAVGGAVKSGANAVTGTVGSGVKVVKDAGKAVGGAVKDAATTAYGWGKTALEKLGSIACTVLKSPLAPAAASAAGAAYGVPPQASAAGVDVAKGFCKSEAIPEVPPQEIIQQGGISPIILIGGGLAAAALLFVALK